jgi:hypothetical protein
MDWPVPGNPPGHRPSQRKRQKRLVAALALSVAVSAPAAWSALSASRQISGNSVTAESPDAGSQILDFGSLGDRDLEPRSPIAHLEVPSAQSVLIPRVTPRTPAPTVRTPEPIPKRLVDPDPVIVLAEVDEADVIPRPSGPPAKDAVQLMDEVPQRVPSGALVVLTASTIP